MEFTNWPNFLIIFREYSKPLKLPIEDFQEAFTHMRIFGDTVTKKILNYNTTCKKNYLLPIVFYSITFLCLMSILRCVLNIWKITRDREIPPESSDKRRISLATIFRVRLGVEMMKLLTYCFLLAGLNEYSGPLMTPWLITQSLTLTLEFLDVLWAVVFRKEQRNLQRELNLILCWFILIFVFSIKNYFDTVEIHMKKSLWF